MHYISTRDHPERRKFCETLLEGLAPDGGLYVPETYPLVDDALLDRWRGLSYPDLAFEILSLYSDDIPPGRSEGREDLYARGFRDRLDRAGARA